MEDRQPLSARKLGQEFRVKHRALLCEHNEAIRPISRKGGTAPALATLDVLLRHRERTDQYISGFETLKDAVHKDGGF